MTLPYHFTFLIFGTLSLLFFEDLSAQSRTEIHNVNFTLHNDSLFINYDLLKADHKERFRISVEIATASGKIIYPVAIIGDVGFDIAGGKGKLIIWDIKKDNIFLNEAISIEVTAVPEPTSSKFFTRGAAVALSTVVPGLGITKLNRGGPYWIMAIGFYGAAVGSYLYYNSANDNYQKYLDSRDEDQRNSLYSTSTNQNTISEALLYTAAAIWVGNMIWTLVTPNKTKPKMNLGFYYDPSAKQPLLSLKYQF
jgi:hypothetical protein